MVRKTGRVRMPKGRVSHPKGRKMVRRASARKLHALSARAKKARLEARRELRLKAQKKALREQTKQAEITAENERLRVEGLLENGVFADFISKNVSKKAIDVIKMLNAPQTDEKLAADLNVKINEVRRILNVLDTYGVARYDTNKDNKGWLTFKWYLDAEKLGELSQTVANARPENGYKLPEDCNDFFYCGRCYEEQKVILPFDAAFEAGFKCESCRKPLKQMTKDEARSLFEQKSATEAKN